MHVFIYYIKIKSIRTHNKYEVLIILWPHIYYVVSIKNKYVLESSILCNDNLGHVCWGLQNFSRPGFSVYV